MSGGAGVRLLTALQHGDSQFPSGGFAFSQGLEASAQLAAMLGSFDFPCFVEAHIRHRWAGSDRVALARAHRLAGDIERLAELDREVEATTFSDGLRAGSRRNGLALLTAHARIGTTGAVPYRALVQQGQACGHLVVVQGLLWQALGLDEESVTCMAGYQAVASLATAAVRLGLIGAIEAQAAVTAALRVVAEVSGDEVVEGQPLRSFTPMTEIAVALRGRSGQRLFSN